MGFDSVQVGNPPNWHRDALSGRVAPNWHWTRIPTLDVSVVGDHKVVWEINRHQYLLAAAFIWLLEEAPHARLLIERHLDSWLQSNPYGVGINWASSLEVSYRAITWCWLLWLLGPDDWNKEIKIGLIRGLELHALHIESYLSTYYSPNTHLTGEALGLLYVSTLLPGSKYADRWRKKGVRILVECTSKHIRPDGTYFEQATQYQRYTTEIILHYLMLSAANGWRVEPEIPVALRKSCNFLRAIRNGEGSIPLLGDDDGGLLLPLDFGSPESIDALLACASAVLEDPAILPDSPIDNSLSVWIAGARAVRSELAVPEKPFSFTSAHFKDGGLIVIRDDWSRSGAVATLDVGVHGEMNCGHAHADALSMTLSLQGSPLFIDRGTLTYVGPERNDFRSTSSHNTLEFEGGSSITPMGPFQWGEIPPPPDGGLADYGPVVVAWGVAQGHIDTPSPSRHQRVVCHVPRGAWLVVDAGFRQGSRGGVVRWQCAPGVSARSVGKGIVALALREAGLSCHLAYLGFSSCSVVPRVVSGRYGARSEALVAELSLESGLRGLSVLVPADESIELSPGRVGWCDATGLNEVRWFGSEEPEKLRIGAGLEVSARCVWTTSFKKNSGPGEEGAPPDQCVLIDPQAVTLAGAVTVFPPVAGGANRVLVLTREGGRWRILSCGDAGCGSEQC